MATLRKGFRCPRLYAIIDRSMSAGRTPEEMAQALLDGGVRLIQYRDKNGSSRMLFEASQAVGQRVRETGGMFIVNDRADIARIVNAEGVHLGQDDLQPDLARRILNVGQLLGVSTHNRQQVIEADRSSADYVAIGPVFATRSKERPDPVVGLEGLREARKLTRKPLVAIGGITLENVDAVINAGVDSVAVIHDLLSAGDLAARAREWIRAIGDV